MDWKLAKNYTIIFLIILNIILFIANLTNYGKYRISKVQKNAVISYLSKNNISIYDDLATEYFPMQQLEAKKVSHDYFNLQDIFFQNTDNIKRTEEFNNTIFSNKTEVLTISSDYIFYEDNMTLENFNYSKENVLKICADYSAKIKKYYGGFNLNIIYENKGYFLAEYISEYGGYNIFNNYILFKIYKDGTKGITFHYLQIEGFLGDKIDICSADEALYIFSKEIKKIFTRDIAIKKMELGYFTNETKENSSKYSLIPYYRIYIKGIDTPFYLNAYTNTFLHR